MATLKVVKDTTSKILEQLKKLVATPDLLVGVPEDTASRDDQWDENINNALLGYLFEFGSPATNMPMRPWLIPVIQDVKEEWITKIRSSTWAELQGKNGAIDTALNQVGIQAASAARKRIRQGIPPPLSERTLKARARRKEGRGVRISQGAKRELQSRAAGNAPSVEFAKPLIDTGNFIKSISYVIRDK